MPTTVISSIGVRAAETVTVNTGVANGGQWDLTLSGAPTSAVAIGDKIAISISATTYYYRITDISGAVLTVSKYWGSKVTSGWASQPDPTTAAMSAPQAGCDITRAFSLPNTTGFWEDSAPADLTTATVDGVSGGCIWKGEMWDDGDDLIAVTTGCVLSGSTSSSTCYKWLRPAPGRSWKELLSTGALRPQNLGAGIRADANATIRFSAAENYSLIEDLVRWTSSSTQTSASASVTGTGACIRGCLILTRNNTGASNGHIETNGQQNSFHDNIVIMGGSNSAETMLYLSSDAAVSEADAPAVYNNTLVRPSDLTAGTSYALKLPGASNTRVRVQNNALLGFGNLCSQTGSTVLTSTSGNNITDLAEGSTTYTDRFPPGGNNLYAADITGSWGTADNLFVNTTLASGDWRAKSTGPLAAAGARVTTPTNHPDTTGGSAGTRYNPASYGGTGDVDILGTARNTSTPYIGAFEVASAAGAALTGGITITSSASADLTKYTTFTGDITGSVVLAGNMTSVARLILDLVTRNGLAQASLSNIKYSIYSGTTVDNLGTLLASGTTEETDGSGRIEIEIATAARGATVMVLLQSSDGTKFYIGTKVLG